MPPPARPTVVVWSAPGTLSGIDARLRHAGARVVRLISMESRPVPAREWIERVVRGPTPDTVVVTSRAAVEAGVRPWRRAAVRLPRGLEFWAVGPGTSAALRAAGVLRARRARSVGAQAIARSIGRGRIRHIVYFRSDRAGPALARSLRRDGHRVLDVVAYRLGPGPQLTLGGRQALRQACLLVVTSPSGFSELRRRLPRADFARLARSTPVVVLGESSHRSARRHGFRRVSIAPSTVPYRFSRHLVRGLDDDRG